MATTSDHPAPRPPLSVRLRPGHWAALDYVFGAFIAVLLFAAARPSLQAGAPLPVGVTQSYQAPLSGPVVLLLILVAGLATALRRRHPVLMLGVLLAESAFLTGLSGRPIGVPVFFLAIAYVLYLIAATYEQRRDAVRVLAAVFATLILDTGLTALPNVGRLNRGSLLLVSLSVIIVWTAGYTVRQRRRYAVRLQDEAASKAVAQERLRIARELHDVVAHSMSVIAVQAGYGQYVIDVQPDDARTALGAIQATSREALDEMRRMLGALRQADAADATRADTADAAQAGVAGAPGVDAGSAASPLFPAPGLAYLDRLITRTAGAGVRVDVTRAGQPRDLPASIDLSAYRIVQEALTNVVKHARTSTCRILLGYREDELTIEVTDKGAGMPVPELVGASAAAAGGTPGGPAGGPPRHAVVLPRGGHGIIGMRERVTLLGGEFSAGPMPGYGFRVSARIPLPPNSA